MTTLVQPICLRCVHFHWGKERTVDGPPPMTCNAYPDEIPFEILKSEVDHHFPYKGDHGIQWEKNNNMPKSVPFPHPVGGQIS